MEVAVARNGQAVYSCDTPAKLIADIARTGYRMSFSDELREQKARSTKSYHLYLMACNHPVDHPARVAAIDRLKHEKRFAEKVMAEAKKTEEAINMEHDRLAAHQIAVYLDHLIRKRARAQRKALARAMRVAAANATEQARRVRRERSPSPARTPPADVEFERLAWSEHTHASPASESATRGRASSAGSEAV